MNVGFFCGVGRDGRSIESRASPFVCGTSSADVGAALVELLRELTDVDDGVGVGEVLALGVALGRALVSVDAAAGDDSDTAAAMVARFGMVVMISRLKDYVDVLADLGKLRLHARAGARMVEVGSGPKWQWQGRWREGDIG